MAHSKSYVIGISDKITHMTMKIAVTSEYEDEKRHFQLRQVSFNFVAKIFNCFKWYIFNAWRLSILQF